MVNLNENAITCIKPSDAVLGACGDVVPAQYLEHHPGTTLLGTITDLQIIKHDKGEVVKRNLELVVQPPYRPYKSEVKAKKHMKRQHKKLFQRLANTLTSPYAMPINLFETKVKKPKPFNRTDYGKVRKERILNNLLNNRRNIKPILVKEYLWPKEFENGAKPYVTYVSKRRLKAKNYLSGQERYCALDSYFKDYGNFDNLTLGPDDIAYVYKHHGIDNFYNCRIGKIFSIHAILPKNGFTLLDCVVDPILPELIKWYERQDIHFKFCETERPHIDRRIFKELQELNYHIGDYVEITVNDYWRPYVAGPGDTLISYNGALIRVGCTYLTPMEITLLTFKYFTPEEQEKYIAMREKYFSKVFSLMEQI